MWLFLLNTAKLNANAKNIKQYLKDIFKNENLHSIILSEETLAQHFLKHPEVTANDYYFVLKSLAKKPLANFESGKNNQLFYYDNSGEIYYRIAIKVTKYNEIFVKSVVKVTILLKKLRISKGLCKSLKSCYLRTFKVALIAFPARVPIAFAN